jgi:hypothetical protein
LDKNEIAGLIEALCDGPLDGQAEPSAELLALRREAAKVLGEAGGDTPDADVLIAALAASLSGSANEAARKTLAELITHSAPARLDAESAASFVETIERSAETAPAHLAEEFSEAGAAPAPRAAAEGFWSRVADGFRPARASRIVAACCVVLVASAATWSLYLREGQQLAGPSAPPAKVESSAPTLANTESKKTESTKPESAKTESASPTPAVADVPAPPAAPKPALAARQPCEPRDQIRQALKTREALRTRSSAVAELREEEKKDDKRTDKQADGIRAANGCDAAPADDADAAIRQAREDAERARQNAAAPAAAAPAGSAPAAAIGAVQTEGAPAQADPAEPRFGTARQPADAYTRPAAKPATRPRELSR